MCTLQSFDLKKKNSSCCYTTQCLCLHVIVIWILSNTKHLFMNQVKKPVFITYSFDFATVYWKRQFQ